MTFTIPRTAAERCLRFGLNPTEAEAMALLEAGVDPAWRDVDGSSIVHRVAFHSTRQALRWLAEHGFALDTTTALGVTPLHDAVLGNNLDGVEELLARGASVHAVSIRKTAQHGHYISGTPLHFALCHGSHKPAIVTRLLEAGADPTVRNDQGHCAIHVAPLAHDAHGPLTALLAWPGHGGVDLPDAKGWTALHHAAASQAPECVARLLKAGADPNAALARTLKTPLHLAAESASRAEGVKVIRLLLARKASPRARQKDGATPLDVATKKKRTLAIDALS